MKPKAPQTPPLSRADAKLSMDHLHEVIHRYRGPLDELESAIGMFIVGRHFGWKALYLAHSKRTIRKYESILGISVRELIPEEGPDANRSAGLRAAAERTNFWRIVSGQDKVDRITRNAIE